MNIFPFYGTPFGWLVMDYGVLVRIYLIVFTRSKITIQWTSGLCNSLNFLGVIIARNFSSAPDFSKVLLENYVT